MLGGTGFLGPHFVEAARAHGHTLTLFNRGKTNPTKFVGAKGVEILHEDRRTDLKALEGERRWDARRDDGLLQDDGADGGLQDDALEPDRVR